MREILVVAILAAVSHPVAGVINAERWAVQEMAARFENAKRDCERASSEMQLHRSGDLFSTESRRFQE